MTFWAMREYASDGMFDMSIELPQFSADEPCPTVCMYEFIAEVVESYQFGRIISNANYYGYQ